MRRLGLVVGLVVLSVTACGDGGDVSCADADAATDAYIDSEISEEEWGDRLGIDPTDEEAFEALVARCPNV